MFDKPGYRSMIEAFVWDHLEPRLMQRNIRSREADLATLVQIIVDNDPNELAADGGITVLDVWREDARKVLARRLPSDHEVMMRAAYRNAK